MQLYSRGGPFLIGLIVGFIFTQKINRKKTFAKMNRLKTTFMWLMILAATGVTVNATFGWNKGWFLWVSSLRYDAWTCLRADSSGSYTFSCTARDEIGGIVWPSATSNLSLKILLVQDVFGFCCSHRNCLELLCIREICVFGHNTHIIIL